MTEHSPPDRTAPRRLLFLDDDSVRAEIFLAENPGAVWVQTVRKCVELLAEPWDEVHLDHDLGGEHFVDLSREDCGMEVVRWLCLEPRPHLRQTQFVVHSHNISAACAMVIHLDVAGYRVEGRPFGVPLPRPPASATVALAWTSRLRSWVERLHAVLLRLAWSPEAAPGPGPGADRPATEVEPPGPDA
jgi:hypothetical protein